MIQQRDDDRLRDYGTVVVHYQNGNGGDDTTWG